VTRPEVLWFAPTHRRPACVRLGCAVWPATPVARPGTSVTAQTPNQTWIDGQAVNLVLPAKTFTDALGRNMMFVAYENAGPNVTPWLHFNAATEDFYGTVPLRASGTAQLAVVAFDGRFMRRRTCLP
jgi:hypothetical protein